MARKKKKRKADRSHSAIAAKPAAAANHQQELPSSELKPRYTHITDDRPKKPKAAAVEEDGFTKLLELLSREQLMALLREAAEASPAAMAFVRRAAEAEPATRKLYVYGLGMKVGAQDLRSAFSRFGEVEDCRVIPDRHRGNRCKGYGFVLFLTRAGAVRALRHVPIQIRGHPAFFHLAATGLAPQSSQSQNPSSSASSGTPSIAPASSSSSHPDSMQRKIFVGNVHADVDLGRLCEYFSQFGEIEEGPLVGFDKNTGEPKGFVLFVYKYTESARRALEEPTKNFDGKVLSVQATDGLTESTPGLNSNANSSATVASAQMAAPSFAAINPYDPSKYGGATDVHDMGFAQQAAMLGMDAQQQAFAQPNTAMLAMMAAAMQNPAMLAALNPIFAPMGAVGQHTGIPDFGAQGCGTQEFAAGGVNFPTAAGLHGVAAYQGGPPGFQGTPGFPTSAGFQVGQAASQTGTTAAAAGATGYQAGAAGQGQVLSSQTGFQGGY